MNETQTSKQEAPVLLLKPEEAARALRISRSAVYNMLMTGELESVQIGRLRRISLDELRGYIERLRSVNSAAA